MPLAALTRSTSAGRHKAARPDTTGRISFNVVQTLQDCYNQQLLSRPQQKQTNLKDKPTKTYPKWFDKVRTTSWLQRLLVETRAGHKIKLLPSYRTAFDSSDAKPCIECSRPCPPPPLLMAAKVLQPDGCKPHTVIATTGCRPSLRFCRRRKGRGKTRKCFQIWDIPQLCHVDTCAHSPLLSGARCRCSTGKQSASQCGKSRCSSRIQKGFYATGFCRAF